MRFGLQKSYTVEESDDEFEDTEEPQPPAEEEEESEIIESDIELEGETVEPDNDPPQKVLLTHTTPFLINFKFYIMAYMF